MSSSSRLLGRLWALPSLPYSLRVFIALAAIMAACHAAGQMGWLMPLFLGSIASAIAETDDSWRGRLRAVGATLACFAAAAFSVQALAPHPWLFAAGMAVATFGLSMLGAVGPRYQALGYATLIASIYTAISMEQHALRGDDPAWIEPVLLVAGAAWYGVLSVIWAALFVHQPVQQALARLYGLLAGYLRVKASLLEPVRGTDVERRRLALAQLNGDVVAALNGVKEGLFSRIRGTRNARTNRYLRLYFLAQDIHERASSSHYPYDELIASFFHSDVLFRAQRVLRLAGDDCEQLAEAIRLRQPFVQGEASRQAQDDLQAALAHLGQGGRSDAAREGLLQTLQALARNLSRLASRISVASQPAADSPADTAATDQALLDRSARTWREALARVRLQLNPGAPLFRHATRLAIALLSGYALMRLFPTQQGYWILLTTLFVCQPGFGATRRRVVQRVVGTFGGLLVGWAIFRLFPDVLVQAGFAVAAGVAFFALRTTRYTFATGAITLLVLLAANQVGHGADLIVPRMVDTLIGSLIAGLAVFAVLPDWQGRRMHQVAARAVAAHRDYLRELMRQYRDGPRDDLPFRLARRNAHNADAALSTAVAGMLREPGFIQRQGDTSVRLLVVSHTLLSYLSGLGAHREQVPPGPALDALLAEAARIEDSLDRIATPLASGLAPQALPAAAPTTALPAADDAAPGLAASQRLAQTQLALLARQLPQLHRLAAGLVPQPAAPSAGATPGAA
ncbi:MAG: TIGR01666 family membrane protein [Burkholderiaceae bacterium]|nr:TIGR01666 family membrane protein [Burkholderiaceae bacterium]